MNYVLISLVVMQQILYTRDLCHLKPANRDLILYNKTANHIPGVIGSAAGTLLFVEFL